MFQSDLFRTVATLVCTVVFSATAVVSAVGPARAGGDTAVAAQARLTA